MLYKNYLLISLSILMVLFTSGCKSQEAIADENASYIELLLIPTKYHVAQQHTPFSVNYFITLLFPYQHLTSILYDTQYTFSLKYVKIILGTTHLLRQPINVAHTYFLQCNIHLHTGQHIKQLTNNQHTVSYIHRT